MKNKYKKKKNRTEVNKYKNSLGESIGGIDSTYHQSVSMLNGSDCNLKEQSKVNHTEGREPIAKKPFRFVIYDWVKENIIGIIITMIMLPMFGWMAKNIIDIQSGRAVIEYRIEKIEERISDDMPNKENLELQIENLKEKFDDLNTDELEDRIESLEKKVNQ